MYSLILISLLVGEGDTPDYTGLFAGVAFLMVAAVVLLLLTVLEKKLAAQIRQEYGEGAMEPEPEEPKAFDLSKNKKGLQGARKKLSADVRRSLIFILLFHLFLVYGLQCGDHRFLPLCQDRVEY